MFCVRAKNLSFQCESTRGLENFQDGQLCKKLLNRQILDKLVQLLKLCLIGKKNSSFHHCRRMGRKFFKFLQKSADQNIGCGTIKRDMTVVRT